MCKDIATLARLLLPRGADTKWNFSRVANWTGIVGCYIPEEMKKRSRMYLLISICSLLDLPGIGAQGGYPI